MNESNKKATEAVADKSNNKDEQQSKLIKKQATEEDSSSPQQFQKFVSDEPPQQQPHPNGTAVLVDVSPSSPTATNGTEEPVAQIPDVVVSLESEEQVRSSSSFMLSNAISPECLLVFLFFAAL